MDSEDGRLVARLGHWLHDCASEGTVEWGDVVDPVSGRPCIGIVVHLVVKLTEWMENDMEELEELEIEDLSIKRDAIDIIRLALLVRPAVMAKALPVIQSSWMPSKQDPEALTALAQGAPCNLQLTFRFEGLRTQLLVDDVSTFLFPLVQDQPPPRGEFVVRQSVNEKFVALRNELLAMRTDWDTLTLPPLRAVVAVDSAESAITQLLQSCDFFVYLEQFARLLLDQTQTLDVNWRWLSTRHTPLQVDKIQLTMNRFCITQNVVAAAEAFMQVGFPVTCEDVNLDLRLISCSESTLLQFVRTLTRGATKLCIETGMDAIEDTSRMDPVDSEGQDRRKIITTILQVIGQVHHVTHVRLGSLLMLCEDPVNRDAIFEGLFEHLLSRPTPLEALWLDGNTSLTPRDAEAIERIAATYRAAHPTALLFVKRLDMTLYTNVSSHVVHQLVLALDDVEQVHVRSMGAYDRINLMPTDFTTVLLDFPSLRRVTLAHVSIPSMDIFNPSVLDPRFPRKPALEELVLDLVAPPDNDSLLRFIRSLDPTSPTSSTMATTLQRLHLRRSYGYLNPGELVDHAARVALGTMLQSNRSLVNLRFPMDPEDSCAVTDEENLMVEQDRPLPAPLAVRRAAYVRARNRAFLSVVRTNASTSAATAWKGLDARVISLIFELSAPFVLREIAYDYEED
jgi:hypothetical protein